MLEKEGKMKEEISGCGKERMQLAEEDRVRW